MQNNKNNKILVAECSKVHGLQGAFQLKELGAAALSLKKDLLIILKNSKKEIEAKVEFVRGMDKKRIIKFYEINDRNEAEVILPFEVYLKSSDDLKPLSQGEYYPFELEGCEAFLENDELVGVVKMFYNSGAQNILLIEKKDGEELDLPLINSFVLKVDKKQKKMVIKLPDYID
jgi:16S rRNA processing protein RimM